MHKEDWQPVLLCPRIDRSSALVPFHLMLYAPPFLSGPGQGVAVVVVHPHEAMPPLVVVPLKGGLHSGAGRPGPLEQIEGRIHNGALHDPVARFPARIAEGKIDKEKTGDTALLDNVARRSHHHRCNAIVLQMPGYQTHGLMAHRSKGGKEHRVHIVFLCPLEKLRGMPFDRPALAVVGGHTVKPRRR